jgi:hypothetical protein
MRPLFAAARRLSAHFERTEAPMKRRAFLYLALMGGAIAHAQQPAEWRPNLAEDNKAATWEDTAAFLTGMLNNTSQSVSRAQVETHCLISYYPTDSRTPDSELQKANDLLRSGEQKAAIVEFRSLIARWPQSEAAQQARRRLNSMGVKIRSGQENSERVEEHQIDFSRVDPLSILVRDTTVHIEGTDGEPIGSSLGARPVRADLSIVMADGETAKRVARAFLHASLVCGGTKAVSPF